MKNLRLKATREISGKTQKQIADDVNIPLRMYQRYESGHTSPNVRVAIKIAGVLNSTVEKIWCETPQTL